MSVIDLSNKFKTKTPKKTHLKHLKAIRKNRLKIYKFSKRTNCKIVILDAKKCANCERIFFSLGCSKCFKNLSDDIRYYEGVLINEGLTNKNRKKPVIKNEKFIDMIELKKMYISGTKFMDIYGKLVEVVIVN